MREDWKTFLRELRDAHARAVQRGQYSTVNHIALRVNDMQQASKLLSEAFGASSIVMLPEEYDRMPGEKDVGSLWLGDLYVELIETEESIDHTGDSDLPMGVLSEIGFFVEDMDHEIERIEKAGMKVLFRGEEDGHAFAHLDTEPSLGVPIELLQVTPDIDKVLGE
jgi:predicted enzyme related to lactoylglutathione lyase